MKKWKKALLTVGISGAVCVIAFLCLAVGLYMKSNREITAAQQTEVTTSVYERLLQDPLPQGEDDVADIDTTPVPLTLSESGLQAFEKQVWALPVDYEYADVYNIDEALALYRENTVNAVAKHTHDIRVSGQLDPDHFYELVKKNNEAFLKEKEEISMAGSYTEYSDRELKDICTQMCQALEAIAKKDPTVDLDTVCCYLYDIVILGRHGSLDFGGFTMDNRFYLNYDNMETGAFAMDTDNIEKTTFYHEMMHAFQFACVDLKKPDEDRMGITHTYHQLEINPLSWYWMLEASAEMNMSQYLGVRYSTYKAMITYLDSLSFAANLGLGEDRVRLEKLCFQWDLDKFFEALQVTDPTQQKEIIKMMYSIEILQKDDRAFYDCYQQTYQVDLNNSSNGEQTALRLRVKEDAMLTMTQLFYRNLARQVHTGKAALQDVYYLMRVWEADLSRHFSNNTVGYMMFFHQFYDSYLILQDVFFSLLANENHLDKAELQKKFANYSMRAATKSPNCDLAFLGAEKKDYVLNDYVPGFYKKGYPSMQSCKTQTDALITQYSLEDIEVNKVLDD